MLRDYFLMHKSNYPWLEQYPDDHDLKGAGVIESTPSSLCRANDGEKFIIKIPAGSSIPDWVHEDDRTRLSLSQIRQELEGPEWQSDEEE